jgi:hypothetical protein
MKTLPAAALSAILFALPAFADKPQIKPYAAGSPSGGIPLWNPGEKFVAVAGGACPGTCPVYELYVFSDGRVIFVGRKYTSRTGVHRKQVGPEAYAELLATIARTNIMEENVKRGTCLKDRPMLQVMRSEPDGRSMRLQALNSGCEGHADAAKQIEDQFILWTEIESWLATPKGMR